MVQCMKYDDDSTVRRIHGNVHAYIYYKIQHRVEIKIQITIISNKDQVSHQKNACFYVSEMKPTCN